MNEIIDEFETLYQVIAGIDGSFVSILKPVESASDYFNLERFSSIISYRLLHLWFIYLLMWT